ncbi:DUF4856 domain-containing protein [Mucilaginibacter sp. UR6-11]|uniref:DUF4856 domain-containing protein n=1 Tax=Mucilaginibacter sp. UR6-11 TaxID=1435644 RepID=UPI001E5C9321|nr:DUF4856 domain-containing protein [Mucilaginibacter sp. UR6-11]MCC8424300.1 DUF4856 domain-containing protein [Mucilaginibacter sp. UR6-11]
MKKYLSILSALTIAFMLITGCKKNDPTTEPVPVYTVPTTYNFTNANFADATTRLGMYTEISNLMKNALTGTFDAAKAKAMLTNTGAPFTTAAYNTSGLQLNDQFAPVFKTDAISFIDSLAKASAAASTPASRGKAGVGASSANAASKYALTSLGVNYAQVFNKGLMGGLVTYQIVTTMDAVANQAIDNTAIVNGATAMEHAWDLAFGYWGVPVDFPTNKTGAKLWGSYSTQVDSGYKANTILMTAFLKGRAAISAKDKATFVAQAKIIITTMERLTGAAALQEVKEAKAAISDNILRNSRVSEMYGFVYSLKYNPKRVITDTQYNALLALFPKSYYDLTLTDVNAIRDAVANQYDFNSVKDIL